MTWHWTSWSSEAGAPSSPSPGSTLPFVIKMAAVRSMASHTPGHSSYSYPFFRTRWASCSRRASRPSSSAASIRIASATAWRTLSSSSLGSSPEMGCMISGRNSRASRIPASVPSACNLEAMPAPTQVLQQGLLLDVGNGEETCGVDGKAESPCRCRSSSAVPGRSQYGGRCYWKNPIAWPARRRCPCRALGAACGRQPAVSHLSECLQSVPCGRLCRCSRRVSETSQGGELCGGLPASPFHTEAWPVTHPL
mmetsp:Transcript_15920/g.44470  ORF Transcript_15920/g.44470 Transcript_15920/m.44470 type:complete len:252 (-) Transcript_15920:118-873(-)